MKKLRHKDITYLAKVIDEQVAEPGSKPKQGARIDYGPHRAPGRASGHMAIILFLLVSSSPKC